MVDVDIDTYIRCLKLTAKRVVLNCNKGESNTLRKCKEAQSDRNTEDTTFKKVHAHEIKHVTPQPIIWNTATSLNCHISYKVRSVVQ